VGVDGSTLTITFYKDSTKATKYVTFVGTRK